jgi:hypothetical protein
MSTCRKCGFRVLEQWSPTPDVEVPPWPEPDVCWSCSIQTARIVGASKIAREPQPPTRVCIQALAQRIGPPLEHPASMGPGFYAWFESVPDAPLLGPFDSVDDAKRDVLALALWDASTTSLEFVVLPASGVGEP